MADAAGDTTLHKTVDHHAVVVALLQYGALPDAANKDGQTATHLAARRGKGDIVRELIERGNASVFIRDKEDKTPLDFADGPEVKAMLEHRARYENYEKARQALLKPACTVYLVANDRKRYLPTERSAAVMVMDGRLEPSFYKGRCRVPDGWIPPQERIPPGIILEGAAGGATGAASSMEVDA